MSQSVIYAAASAPAEPIVSVPVADACCDLLELFAGVSDGRVGPGRDHPVAAVLALAAAAVVAGMRGYTAITGWVADVPPAILADVYLRSGAAAVPPPSKTTIWRVLTDADAGAFDVAVGTWLMSLAGFTIPAVAGRDASEQDCPPALMQVRLDGKAIRGAKDADGNQVRLLAALIGLDAASSVVAAQAEVGKKTNEVPMATVVLGQIDLNNKIVTGCATPCIKRTNPRSEPEMAPESWLLSATSQSAHSEWPDAPTSPKPPDGPGAPWTAHSPSSDSHHDLGTAVVRRARIESTSAVAFPKTSRPISTSSCPDAGRNSPPRFSGRMRPHSLRSASERHCP